MSSTTWTPTEVASNAKRLRCQLWRAVEAQHRVSTISLVDSLAEQAELEALLDATKPPLPAAMAGLHYLLATPFRYPPLTHGSRFRSATDPGVFYGADERRTACAELGFWRWRFLLDSPELAGIDARPQTVFKTRIDGAVVDLRTAPLNRDAATWTDPRDHSGCQSFAAIARAASVDAIRYQSVRDPQHEACTAVLKFGVFTRGELVEQTWLLSVTRVRIFWHRDSAIHAESFEFDTASWGLP